MVSLSFGSTPEYGDIVIPVHPKKDVDYIKRVVALPGDVIEVRPEAMQGILYINGERVQREMVPPARIPYEPELMCETGIGGEELDDGEVIDGVVTGLHA